MEHFTSKLLLRGKSKTKIVFLPQPSSVQFSSIQFKLGGYYNRKIPQPQTTPQTIPSMFDQIFLKTWRLNIVHTINIVAPLRVKKTVQSSYHPNHNFLASLNCIIYDANFHSFTLEASLMNIICNKMSRTKKKGHYQHTIIGGRTKICKFF